MPALRSLLDNERVNATLSWPIVASIAVAAVLTAVEGSLLWAGMAVTVVGLALVPAIARRSALAALPWELVALAAAPIWLRLFRPLPISGFLTVATIALLVTAELNGFTPIEMTPGFAVGFVVLTTMAVAGLWVVAQWISDVLLSTSFLVDKVEVMWDLVYATAFGVLAAALFVLYFRERGDADGMGSENTPGGTT